MVIFENIDIDKAILKNIDVDIDKEILEIIDIDKISISIKYRIDYNLAYRTGLLKAAALTVLIKEHDILDGATLNDIKNGR